MADLALVSFCSRFSNSGPDDVSVPQQLAAAHTRRSLESWQCLAAPSLPREGACRGREQLPGGVAASQPCPGDLGAPFSLTCGQLAFFMPSFPVEESVTRVLFAFHCPVKLPVIFLAPRVPRHEHQLVDH